MPAASVARAENVVVASGVIAEDVTPAAANVAALPLPAAVPAQLACLNTVTVVAASALPITLGVRSLPGDAGEVDVIVGGPGAMLSCV